ncbi:hypothetical protein F5Y14DRAFT_42840 [Nemania sp. NC0429]|nr:hypothetical protein F5Y14DRAFT_42840 [Nemania sp. NC0429]
MEVQTQLLRYRRPRKVAAVSIILGVVSAIFHTGSPSTRKPPAPSKVMPRASQNLRHLAFLSHSCSIHRLRADVYRFENINATWKRVTACGSFAPAIQNFRPSCGSTLVLLLDSADAPVTAFSFARKLSMAKNTHRPGNSCLDFKCCPSYSISYMGMKALPSLLLSLHN